MGLGIAPSPEPLRRDGDGRDHRGEGLEEAPGDEVDEHEDPDLPRHPSRGARTIPLSTIKEKGACGRSPGWLRLAESAGDS